MSAERDKAHAQVREFGSSLVKLGKRLRGLSRSDFEDVSVPDLVQLFASVRGSFDEIINRLPN